MSVAPGPRREGFTPPRISHYLGRRGIGFFLGLSCSMAGSVAGLRAAGLPWWLAVVCSIAVHIGLLVAALSAWLPLERLTLRGVGGRAVQVLAFVYIGALAGFMVGFLNRPGPKTLDELQVALVVDAWNATPVLVVIGVGALVMIAGAASVRRQQMQRALSQLQLKRERDAAARQAAEAKLQLLQAQIQPHFLFNTLATLQHWVDSRDDRAAGLLRSLTTFLRGAAEMFSKPSVTLAEESRLARNYLSIMQARFGARLRCEFDLAADAAEQLLPPGLLMTLVENAVEHGIERSLHGGEVRVTARRGNEGFELHVDDDGAGLDAGWQDGLGIANCRERLRHRYGNDATLELAPRADGLGVRAAVRIAAHAHHPPTTDTAGAA